MVALMVLAAACATSSNAPKSGQQVILDGQRVLNHGTIDVGGQTAEDVQTHDFYFDPTILSGSGGQTITISVHNTTSKTHNFSLPLQQIDQDVGPAQSLDCLAGGN